MSTEGIHLMTLPELRHELKLTGNVLKGISRRVNNVPAQLMATYQDDLAFYRNREEVITNRIKFLERRQST